MKIYLFLSPFLSISGQVHYHHDAFAHSSWVKQFQVISHVTIVPALFYMLEEERQRSESEKDPTFKVGVCLFILHMLNFTMWLKDWKFLPM